jgi:hypothetical protein
MNEAIRRRLVERGVTAAFAARAVATPSDQIWYPTPEELVAAGVIAGPLTQSALPR